MNLVKIALPNKDLSSSDARDFVLHSSYPNPKIDTTADPKHAGIIFLNWASTGITVAQGSTKILYTFKHNYNYIPTVFGSYKFDNGSTQQNGTLPIEVGSLGIILLDADQTNINLKYYSLDLGSVAVPPFLLNVKFYVMAERGWES